MELNRNPENYFAEVEQAAFNPANIVPGIGFSPDKMLQGRFSWRRAALSPGREPSPIPVNAPRCPVDDDQAARMARADAGLYEPKQLRGGSSSAFPDAPPLLSAAPTNHWNRCSG